MPTNYTLTPADDIVPEQTLYGDSLDAITRSQTRDIERLSVRGADPVSENTGIQPGTLTLRGYYLGSKAADRATALRDNFISAPSIDKIDLQAVDESGSDVANPFNGTYRLADEATVQQRVAFSDAIWSYTLPLVEP